MLERSIPVVVSLLVLLAGAGCPADETEESNSADASDTSDVIADVGDSDDGDMADSDDEDAGRDTMADGSDTGGGDVSIPDSTDHFEWVRYNDWEFGQSSFADIDIGPDGGVYVAGVAQSAPDEPTPDDVAPNGVIAKYAADGTFQWAHVVEATVDNQLTALHVDDAGTARAVGWGSSGDAESEFWSEHTAFMVEVTSDGDLESREEILAEGTATPLDISFLDNDPVVVGTGEADSFASSDKTGQFGFVSRLNPETAETRWITFLGAEAPTSARSLAILDGTIPFRTPVLSEEGDRPYRTTLYAVEGDGSPNNGNSIPITGEGELPHVSISDDRVRLGGRRQSSEGNDLNAYTAGGSPVYPVAMFKADFGTDGLDYVTDVENELTGSRAWYVGRQNVNETTDESSAFAARYDESGSQLAQIVFGDEHPAGTTPRGVAVTSDGTVYIAGGTFTPFGVDERFGSQAGFVGQLRTDSGP